MLFSPGLSGVYNHAYYEVKDRNREAGWAFNAVPKLEKKAQQI